MLSSFLPIITIFRAFSAKANVLSENENVGAGQRQTMRTCQLGLWRATNAIVIGAGLVLLAPGLAGADEEKQSFEISLDEFQSIFNRSANIEGSNIRIDSKKCKYGRDFGYCTYFLNARNMGTFSISADTRGDDRKIKFIRLSFNDLNKMDYIRTVSNTLVTAISPECEKYYRHRVVNELMQAFVREERTSFVVVGKSVYYIDGVWNITVEPKANYDYARAHPAIE